MLRQIIFPPALLLLTGVFILSPGPAAGENTAEARVRHETIRQAIQTAFDELMAGDLDRDQSREKYAFHNAVVAEFGTEATAFLLPEIENPADSFFIALGLLGEIGDPEAIPVLRKALDLADEQGGNLGRDRKAWVGVTLARLGAEDAVDLLEDGNTAAGATALFLGKNSLELAAMATAPASVERLINRFVRVTEEGKDLPEEEQSEAFHRRFLLLRAARSATHSHPHERLLKLARKQTSDSSIGVRRELMGILLDHGDRQDMPRALAGLEDPSFYVRLEAAKLLTELSEQSDALKILTALKGEANIGTRSVLQAELVRLLGERAVAPLEEELRESDPVIRINAVRAAGRLGAAGLPILHRALRDADLRVGLNAQRVLRRQRNRDLLDALLPHLLDDNWAFAQTSVATVTDLAPELAGPRIAGRLMQKELKTENFDYGSPARIQFLLQELVRTRFTLATNDLERAVAAMEKPALVSLSQPYLAALRVIEKYKDDPAGWRKALQAEEPDVRTLARERLLELGDDDGIAAIATSFLTLTPEEQAHCLAFAAQHPHKALAEHVANILSSAEFDSTALDTVRRQAAWVALTLGTGDMRQALAENVQRRQGIDYIPFLYWIEMDPEAAIPWIEKTRLARMFAIRHDRNFEQQVLDRLERRWRRKIHPDGIDLPPSELAFQM